MPAFVVASSVLELRCHHDFCLLFQSFVYVVDLNVTIHGGVVLDGQGDLL